MNECPGGRVAALQLFGTLIWIGEQLLDCRYDCLAGFRMTEMIQHHCATPNLADRVCNASPRYIRG
jgi:hypothetical protein